MAEAKDTAGKLANVSVSIRAKTVDGTRLYGSIVAADLVASLEEGNKITVDKTQVVLPEPLKETGTFDVSIKLHPEVTSTLKVWIVEG